MANETQWTWKDYTFRANYQGMMLVVNQNNQHWHVQNGGEIVERGEHPDLEERKAAALDAAIKLKGVHND